MGRVAFRIGQNVDWLRRGACLLQYSTKRYEHESKRFPLAEDNEINALVFMGLIGEEGLGTQIDWAEDAQAALDAGMDAHASPPRS